MKIICFILALITTKALPYFLNMTSINNIFLIPIIAFLYLFYKRQYPRINKRKGIFAFLFSLLFSLCYVLGKYFEINKTVFDFISLENIYYLFSLGIFVFNITIFIYSKLETGQFTNKLNLLEKKKTYIFIFLLFIITLLPSYLALFPGLVTVDSYDQLSMISTDSFTAHHPLIHTLLLMVFYNLGITFNNPNLGIALLSFFQMCLLSLAFTYVVYKIYYYTKNKYIVLFSILFFILCPINSILMMYMTKDIIFSALFLIFFVMSFDFIIDNKYSKKNSVVYLIIGILMCLFRNQGVYVVIFTLIFTLIFYRKKKFILLLILIPVLTIGVNKTLMIITDASSTKTAEMFSVPIQQLARAYNLNKESFTKEQLDTLYNYLPKKSLVTYIPEIADPVKKDFNNNYFKKDKLSFIKLWFSIGLKNKTNYVDSFLYGSYGYFYLDVKMPHWGDLFPYHDSGNKAAREKFGIKEQSYLKDLKSEKEKDILRADYQNDFLLGLLASPALPFILLSFNIIYCFYKRIYKLLVPLAFIFGMWGTLILGPVISIRYIYPLMLCVPFLAVLPIFFFNINKTND